MKTGIHPKYHEVVATCACGETFTARSTNPELRLEICSKCHPFFTGRQKLIDSAGRVERFEKRYKAVAPAPADAAGPAAAGAGSPAAGRSARRIGATGAKTGKKKSGKDAPAGA